MKSVLEIVDEKNTKRKMLGKKEWYFIVNDKVYININNVDVKDLVIPDFVYGIYNEDVNKRNEYNFIIESIEFKDNIKFISKSAFSGFFKLRYISDLDKVNMKDCESLFSVCRSLIKAPALPNNAENISSTFRVCRSLVEPPEIPKGVTDMDATFYECDRLERIPLIPYGVKDMNNTFAYCTSLSETSEITTRLKSMRYTFFECKKLVKLKNIPDSVIDITGVCANCTSLKESPVIPHNVMFMDDAFIGCELLVSAPIIPEGVVSMKSAFANCSSLTGYLTINSNTKMYNNFLYNSCTKVGTRLVLRGESVNLDEMYNTVKVHKNITKE